MCKSFGNMFAREARDIIKILMLFCKFTHLINPIKIVNFTTAMKQINRAGMSMPKCIGQNTRQRS